MQALIRSVFYGGLHLGLYETLEVCFIIWLIGPPLSYLR